jgi:hypothetical protein
MRDMDRFEYVQDTVYMLSRGTEGKLKVDDKGVWWRGAKAGQLGQRYEKGATTPGGMVTNQIWIATKPNGDKQEFRSKTEALEWLLGEKPKAPKG